MRGEQALGGRWGETAASAAAQHPVQLQQPITQASESEGCAPGAFWNVASACAAGRVRAVASEEAESAMPAAVPSA